MVENVLSLSFFCSVVIRLLPHTGTSGKILPYLLYIDQLIYHGVSISKSYRFRCVPCLNNWENRSRKWYHERFNSSWLFQSIYTDAKINYMNTKEGKPRSSLVEMRSTRCDLIWPIRFIVYRLLYPDPRGFHSYVVLLKEKVRLWGVLIVQTELGNAKYW